MKLMPQTAEHDHIVVEMPNESIYNGNILSIAKTKKLNVAIDTDTAIGRI